MNLHTEKSIEIMNNYRLITKYVKVVSVSNDGNEHMIIVSQIQKNDRPKKKVCVGASFSAFSSCTYKLRRRALKS